MNRKNRNRVQGFFYKMPLFNRFVVYDISPTDFYYEDDAEGKEPHSRNGYVYNSATWRAMYEIDTSKLPAGEYTKFVDNGMTFVRFKSEKEECVIQV